MTQTALSTLRYSDEQTALIRRTLAPELDSDQFALFMTIASRSGLDPIAKQIYAIPRKKRVKEGNDWVERVEMTIQTGIDGYRAIAQRSGHYTGQAAAEWCGPDGIWKDVWLSDDPPAAARATVYRDAEPFVHTALYKEYVQTVDRYEGQGQNRKKVATEPNSMWKSMPANQLAKCAEAGAMRKAFPVELAGVFVDAEEAGIEYVISVENERNNPPARPQIQRPQSRSKPAPQINQPHAKPFGAEDDEAEVVEGEVEAEAESAGGDDFEAFYEELHTGLGITHDLKDVAAALEIAPTRSGVKSWWEAHREQGNLVPYILRKLSA